MPQQVYTISPKPIKQVCLNCHFLQYVERVNSDTDSISRYPSLAERLDLESRPSGEGHFFSMYCAEGVWAESELVRQYGGMPERYEEILDTERENKCYFFPYTPSMDIKTAKDLWSRQEESRLRNEDKKFTQSQD